MEQETSNNVNETVIPDKLKFLVAEETPWQKVTLQNERTVEMVGDQQRVIDSQVMIDFKTHVLTADKRPIDFQIFQMMNALRMLMDVCEKQQKQIDSLILKTDNKPAID